MVATFLLAFIALLCAFAAMGLGLFSGRRPIGGSCGGVAAVLDGNRDRGEGSCPVCGRERSPCDQASSENR